MAISKTNPNIYTKPSVWSKKKRLPLTKDERKANGIDQKVESKVGRSGKVVYTRRPGSGCEGCE